MPKNVGFNLSSVFDTVARTVPDRDLLVWRGRRFTYAETNQRANGIATFFAARGFGCHRERELIANHESGQDHIALYLRNGNEYLETMIGCYRSRTVPINVNFRYVRDELAHLMLDSGAKAVVYHDEFAPLLAEILPLLPDVRVLIQVADETGNALLPGAVAYEDVVKASARAGVVPEPSPDDLYVLYTGGTTGLPKGVLWRQHDAYITSMGGTPFGSQDPFDSYEAIAEAATTSSGAIRLLVMAPFMHGAAQWSAFHAITNGGTIVLPDDVRALDAAQVLRAVQEEQVVSLPIIGDAMARPLIDELETNPDAYDLSCLVAVSNGSAPLTPAVRDRLMKVLPHVLLIDSAGSSETGIQMSAMSGKDDKPATAVFKPHNDTAVVNEQLTHVLGPGSGSGWLARTGRIPLGYLGDAAKTELTFPMIDGVRWAIPGDRVRQNADGTIELLGRDGVTINSGGEKIFAEEVERVVAGHPLVRDVVVVGRPSDRWGQEVCALVELSDPSVSDSDLLHDWRTRIARYKLPKTIIRTAILRSPSGKADYRWAQDVARNSTPVVMASGQ